MQTTGAELGAGAEPAPIFLAGAGAEPAPKVVWSCGAELAPKFPERSQLWF